MCFQIWFRLGDRVLIFSFTRLQADYNEAKRTISALLKSLKVGSKRQGTCIMKTLPWNGFEVKYPSELAIISYSTEFSFLIFIF
jgi:hypothetical protein